MLSPQFETAGHGSQNGCSFEVTGGPEAGAAARQALVADDGLPTSVRDDVLLLLTELVTNAVRHAGVGPEQAIRVELLSHRQLVRVEVTDRGRRFARIRPRSGRDESGGWGLFLVDAVADRWGVASAEIGTCVWFEISCA
jgi:serine/threonine-protein kinase RsbW